MQINYQPIGIIHSPFDDIAGMPIQPSGAAGLRGVVEIFPEYTPGLKDLEGFSHLFLLYHFHRAAEYKPLVTPFMDSQPRGLFSTRAPRRPNPIGLSVVNLVSVKDNLLYIENVDILDGTPLLDLKPYVPEFDLPVDARVGWLERSKGQASQKKSDDRFR